MTTDKNHPIWVQDLLTWLDKIKKDEENFAERVEELLAELPGQGLTEKDWVKAKENDSAASDEKESHFFSDADRDRFRQELKIIHEIDDEKKRSRGLAAIAIQLPADETQLLQAALEVVISIKNDKWRSQALVTVAARLSTSETQLLATALYAANEIKSGEYRSPALAAVAAQLPASERQFMLSAALEDAKAIENEYFRAQTLAVVVAQLPASETQLLASALGATDAIKDEKYRCQALAAVAAKIPSSQRELLQSAFDVAKEIKKEEYRSQALTSAIAQLPSSETKLLKSAIVEADGIKDERYKSQVLVAVAAKLPDSKRKSVIQRAIDAISDIKSEQFRSQSLAAVTSQIRDSETNLLQAVLDTASTIESEQFRFRVLATVTVKIVASDLQLLQAALDAAKMIASEQFRSQALSAVAAKIPTSETQLLQAAIDTASAFASEQFRAQALIAIAAKISPSQPQLLQIALDIANDIESEQFRSQALTAIAAQIPASETKLLQEILDIANDIESEQFRSQALAAITAQIPAFDLQSVLKEALHVANDIESEQFRAQALTAIVAKISPSQPQLLQTALDIANAIKSEQFRSQALAAIAAKISPSQSQLLQIALDIANDIESEQFRSQALAAIAPQLPTSEKQLLEEAFHVANAIKSEQFRSQALAAIAAQLPPSERELVLLEALDVANTINDKDYQSQALAAIAAQLPTSERKSVLLEALNAANAIKSDEYRSPALVVVIAQIPVSESQLLEFALDAANAIEYAVYRVPVLVSIAAQIPAYERQSVLASALESAKAIKDEQYRSQALAAVVAQIPSSETQLLQSALDAAFQIENKKERINALSNIAFHFTEFLLIQSPPSQTSTILEIVAKGKTSADKAKLLSALAPRLSIGLFPRALQLIQEINHPAYQAEALSNIAPYLPIEQLTEALVLVKDHITGSTYRTTALCNLIPRLSLDQLKKTLDISFKEIKHPDLLAQILQISATRLCLLDEEPAQEEPSLKRQLIQQILDCTLALTHEKSIASILTAILPSLDLSQDWYKIAAFLPLSVSQITESKLKSEFYRAQVLAAIAPKLSTDLQINFFLDQVTSFTQEQHRAKNINAFRYFHPDKNFMVIDIVKILQKDSIYNPQRNNDLAIIFATLPHYPSRTELDLLTKDQTKLDLLTKDQTKLLRIIRQQTNDLDKANYLIQLIPHLLPTQVQESQNLAQQEIDDDYHQAKTLIALSTRFPQVRTETKNKVNKIKDKKADIEKGEIEDKYLIQHIELMCEFAIIAPEQIPYLLKTIEDWYKPESISERKNYKRTLILKALKPHLPIRLSREIDRETSIGKAPQDLWDRSLFVLRNEYRQALKSGSLRNDAAQNEDLLDIKDEINALTEMLLMRDLTPPVAVGILGGWGGGKSYIMHLMQKHMVEIRSRGLAPVEAWGFKDKDEKNPDSSRLNRYVGHIYQIKFDAWTYAKSDLWASLMQTIFFELDRQISLEQQIDAALQKANPKATSLDQQNGDIWEALYQTNDEDREWFLKNVLTGEALTQWGESSQFQSNTDQLWDLFAESENNTIKKIEYIQSELEKQKTELQNKHNEILDQQTQKQIFSAVSKAAIAIFDKRLEDPLIKEILAEKLKKSEKYVSELKSTSEDANKFFDSIKIEFKKQEKIINFSFIKKFISKNIFLIFLCGLLIFAAIFIPNELIKWDFISKFGLDERLVQVCGFLSPLLGAIPFLKGLIKKGQTLYNGVKTGVSEFQQQVEKGVQRQLDTNSDFKKLNRQVQSLEKELEIQYAAIPTNTYASIADFVKDRVQKGGYQEHLGMMHQVKEDLSMLSKRLLPPPADSKEYTAKVRQLEKVFPRGSARVVLYIDDLDRCPPKTVVEVLEAVQLLVKNPLFIAILAIDERYITRALADHYKGVLPLKGRPSASDYLEKIIQIPYRIRPISEQALRQYLRAQIVVQDGETSGTKFNEFSPEEFDLLVKCCQESELSPRSLKRLTNVYKLYKVLSRTRGKTPTQKEQKSILTLLAFSSRYPDLMRDILQEIGSIFEHGQNTDHDQDQETLFNVFKTYLYKPAKNSYLAEDVKQLTHDFEKLVATDLKLEEIRDIFDFVRTFSFVGDIGVDHTQ